jgi:hypothetical protein
LEEDAASSLKREVSQVPGSVYFSDVSDLPLSGTAEFFHSLFGLFGILGLAAT